MDNPAPAHSARVLTLQQAAEYCDLKPRELLVRAAEGEVELTIRIPPAWCAHIVLRNYVSERPGQYGGKGILFPHLVMPIPHHSAHEVALTRAHCSDILAFDQCDALFFPAALEYTKERGVEFRRLLDRKIIPGWRELLEGHGYAENRSLSTWPDFAGDPPPLIAAEQDELSYLVAKEGLLYPRSDSSLEERLQTLSGNMPYPALLRRDMENRIREAELALLDEKPRQEGHVFEYWFALYPTGHTPGLNQAKEIECPAVFTVEIRQLRITEEELERIAPTRITRRPEVQHVPSDYDFEMHKNTSQRLKMLNKVSINVWSKTSPYDDTFPDETEVIKLIMDSCGIKDYLARSAELIIRPDYANPQLPPDGRPLVSTSFRSTRWKRVLAASKKYWGDVDPTDPKQCTHNDIVRDWLVGGPKKYMPLDVASHAAGLIRPDNAKKSRKSKKTGKPGAGMNSHEDHSNFQ